jgi:WD40 repeat protein
MPRRVVRGKTVAAVAALLSVFALGRDAAAGGGSTDSLKRTGPQRQDAVGEPLPPRALARLGTTRLRHVGIVQDACLTPDGKLLCTCTLGGNVWVWDTATGKLQRHFSVERSWVRSLACSPDGKSLVGIGGQGTIYIWELRTGEKGEFPIADSNPRGNCTAVAFSPDGKSLAVAAGPKVALCDVPGYRTRHLLTWANFDAFPSIAFSPDGKMLAVGTGRSSRDAAPIYIWDTKTGEKIGQLEGYKASVSSVSFSVDGKSLVSIGRGRGIGEGRSIRLWDLSTQRTVKQFDRGLRHLFYAPGGKNLVSAADDGTVRIWDPGSGKELFKVVVPERHGSHRPTFSADGKLMATWSNSTVHLWSVPTGKELLPLHGHIDEVLALTFTPDGKGLLSRASSRYSLWDWREAKELRRYPKPAPSGNNMLPGHMLAVSPDGTLLAVDTYPGMWEVHTGKDRAARSRSMVGSLDFAFLPDGDTLAFCTGERVGLWSVRLAKDMEVFDLEPDVSFSKRQFSNLCMAASPDGEALAVAGSDKHLRFWNRHTGALRQVKLPVTRPVGGLAYSPDGSMLASCGRSGADNYPLTDPVIRLWDAATGKLLRELEGHKGAVVSVAFSPDGLSLATAGEADRTVRLWNAFTGQQLACFEGHTGPVYCVAFSPDGRVLASGSGDTTILLWDLRDVKPQAPAPVADADALRKLWGDLKGEPSRAYAATWALAGGGDKAVALLSGHVRPAAPADAARVRKLLADLESNDFPVRTAAAKELARLGKPVEAALRQRLTEKPDADLRKRLEQVLAEIAAAGPPAESLAQARAVQVLELIGSAEARALLKELAAGAPAVPLTRSAKAALQRLDRRAEKR